MPIALLKFPTDLLGDIFKLCDPFQLYCLSKCSKRTQRSIQLGGTKKWKLSFRGRNAIVASLDGLHYNFGGTEDPDEYFETQKNWRFDNYMTIPFGEPFDVFFGFLGIFRIVEELDVAFGSFEQFSKAIRELIDRHIEIERIWIGCTPKVEKVDKLMPILNQLNITQKFSCLKKFPSEFRHQFDKYPNRILLHHSFWFNISQLLECTCDRIDLRESILSNQDMDMFFQKWKRPGSFPNLRWLHIAGENIDDKSSILEIIPPILNVNNPRVEVADRLYKHDNIVDPVRITKADGTEGWLKVELGSWPELKFLVLNPIAPNT
ncbi:hypothetical protein B9Z55_003682 [Caenorhabditis nigoni]|nr:hypothetical protein B9Z55_003682 [Caenorhabditis nigoni]